MRVAHPFGGSF